MGGTVLTLGVTSLLLLQVLLKLGLFLQGGWELPVNPSQVTRDGWVLPSACGETWSFLSTHGPWGPSGAFRERVVSDMAEDEVCCASRLAAQLPDHQRVACLGAAPGQTHQMCLTPCSLDSCVEEALMKTLQSSEGTSCFVFKELFSEVCGNAEKTVIAF